tara:strand:- start:1268 stop:1828 length:561 start_codon:yes stop_codon:yes gene_type:complete
MPIGLEVNDYDSEEDVSSTEDENINLPVVNKTNKKVKPKKKPEKSVLKESKIVKERAKKRIKNMENEVKDINSVNYLEKNKDDQIIDSLTPEELKQQLDELRRLEALNKHLWKIGAKSHRSQPEIEIRKKTIGLGVPTLYSSINNRRISNSRTQILNSSSRVNTKVPLLGGGRIISRSYNNIGKMW